MAMMSNFVIFGCLKNTFFYFPHPCRNQDIHVQSQLQPHPRSFEHLLFSLKSGGTDESKHFPTEHHKYIPLTHTVLLPPPCQVAQCHRVQRPNVTL